MNVFKNKKYINWFFIILCVQVLSGIGFFIYGCFSFHDDRVNFKNNATLGIDALAGYLKLIAGNSAETTNKIGLHNFALVCIAYVLNIFTLGISGCIFLARSCFVFSITLKQDHSLATVIFVLLEALGVFASCLVGIYIPYKRRKDNLSIKNMLLISLSLIIFLALIYFAAGLIEANIIKSELR